MRVKIMKCSKDVYWYSDKIGQEFEVSDDGSFYYAIEDTVYGERTLIAKLDCEIIEIKTCDTCDYKVKGYDCYVKMDDQENCMAWTPIKKKENIQVHSCKFPEEVIEKGIVKYLFSTYEDRHNAIRAFANNGYPVWVEEEDASNLIAKKYYVCVGEKKC